MRKNYTKFFFISFLIISTLNSILILTGIIIAFNTLFNQIKMDSLFAIIVLGVLSIIININLVIALSCFIHSDFNTKIDLGKLACISLSFYILFILDLVNSIIVLINCKIDYNKMDKTNKKLEKVDRKNIISLRWIQISILIFISVQFIILLYQQILYCNYKNQPIETKTKNKIPANEYIDNKIPDNKNSINKVKETNRIYECIANNNVNKETGTIRENERILTDRINEVIKVFNDICSICTVEFQIKDKINVLSCKHAFHSSCILDWLRKLSDNDKKCPNCNSKVEGEGITGEFNLAYK